MGCFSGNAPQYQAPAAPKLPTADELFASGTNYAKTNDPLAYGAREGALSDLQDPTAYYSKFQPTSFEQALGNQQFKNIWPDQQAYMMNLLGKSGMASSPVAATTLGNAYGNLSTNIGQYLDTQANNRANQSLTARLGIDPMSMVTPFVNTGMQQSNNQANLDYNAQLNAANANYANALQKYNSQNALSQLIGQGVGAAGGFMAAGPAGASIGSGLGGVLTGGNMNLGSIFQGAQGMNNQPFGGIFGNQNGSVNDLSQYGGGISNAWNANGGVGRAQSVFPNLSLRSGS